MAGPLTVLIPTHGRPTLLRRTLESLSACALPAGYREAVVVENGSRDGAEAVVKELAAAHPALRLRYLHVEWGNKSHALNEALETVGGGLVVFFDDDVRLDPGVLAAYAEAAEGYDGGAFFGGTVRIDYEEEPPEWLIPYMPYSARGFELESTDRPGWGEYLGLNWAAFAEDVRKAGGFDPAFGPGSPTGATGQETRMQSQLLDRSVKPVDVPSAVVWHYVSRDRCSAKWIVSRRFRSGLEHGQRARDKGHRGVLIPSLGSVLRCLASVGKQTVRRNHVGRWGALIGLSRSVGFIKGYYGPRLPRNAIQYASLDRGKTIQVNEGRDS